MKRIASLLIVLGLLIAAVPTVFANDEAPTTGEININGSAAHIESDPFVMQPHSLDGTDLGNANYLIQDLSPAGYDDPGDFYDGYNQSWQVTDPRGTGAGWHVNVSATDFVAVAGPAFLEDPVKTIPLEGIDAHVGVPLFHMQLVDDVNDGGIVWIDGQCGDLVPVVGACSEATATLIPETSAPFTGYTPLSGIPQEFVNAIADTGMGSYYLNPQFRLFVPAETYAGRYRSAITVTLIAGDPDAEFVWP